MGNCGRQLSSWVVDGSAVWAHSGISASALARAVGWARLSGLEHIVGIPGTLGGLILMNGGRLRQTIGETVVEVTTLDRRGNTRVFSREQCEFSYRHGRFQGSGRVVTRATMQLVPGRRDVIMAESSTRATPRPMKLSL